MIGSILNPTKERRWRLSADSADMKLSSSGCNFSQRAAGGLVAGVRPCGILICTVLFCAGLGTNYKPQTALMSSLGGVTTRPAAQRPAAREKLVMRNNKNISIHKKLEWNKAGSARPEPLISTIPRLIFKLQYDELGMYYLNFLTNGRISGIGVPSIMESEQCLVSAVQDGAGGRAEGYSS